ncbi:hypothetical protein ACWCV2_16900 [Streptomyces pseudogriseolus]
MKDAPTADINEWGTLLCLAEAADEDGCNAFPSVKTMAAYAKISTRTVQRALGAMVERKLIAEGDQRAAQYIPEYRRPTVYDLLIPYDWFRDIDRTNAFRARLGRRPLTPADRPPIKPAPPKKKRADAGQPKPKKTTGDTAAKGEQEGRQEVTPVENGPSEEGRLEVTRVENPETGATTSQGVTSSPERGDFKSEGGRLVVTQPTPSTRTTDQPLPSVGSTGTAPGTEDGGTDGSALGIGTQKKRARTVERTPGVDLLLGVGNEQPELLLSGKVLADQGRVADGLLLSGWPPEMIVSTLLRPLPTNTRSVGAVLARRLSDLAATPLPRTMAAMPSPRSGDSYRDRYEDSDGGGWQPDTLRPGEDVDGMVLRRTRFSDCKKCRNPIVTATGTDLCVRCEGWPRCPVCQRFVQPGTACESCEVRPDEVEFEVCETHGDRFIAGTACFQCVAPSP